MNRLRLLRIEAGLTQAELGEKLNVRDAAVSKYENEKIPLTAETLLRLSDIFNVSIDYILGKDVLKDFQNDLTSDITDEGARIAADYYMSLSDNGKREALKYLQMLKEFEDNRK